MSEDQHDPNEKPAWESVRKFIGGLIRKHSIRVGQEFELSSGRKSNVYCDLKQTMLRADVLDSLGILLACFADDHFGDGREITAFAGVALGGCHLATLAASQPFGRDVIYVRKEVKNHGTKNLIEAPDKMGDDRVVLFEDVTTTAQSAAHAVKVLQEGGYKVLGIITVVDRRGAWTDTPPADTVEGVPIFSLFRIEELVPASGAYY